MIRFDNKLPPGTITVLIPAWHSGRMILPTLRSLLRQTFRDFTLLISLDDASNDPHHTENKILRLLAATPHSRRTIVVAQKKKLGWVKHCNFLLASVETRLVSILPHDDLLRPNYLEALCAAKNTHPQASVVYCDLQLMGAYPVMPGAPGRRTLWHWQRQVERWLRRPTPQHLAIQPSITGTQKERVRDLLLHHFNAPAFRGLVDREVMGHLLPLPSHSLDLFAADTLWMLHMALSGDLIRVPQILYVKRGHRNNTHIPWMQTDQPRLRRQWRRHCTHCRDILAKEIGLTWPVTRWLVQRLLQRKQSLWIGRIILPRTRERRKAYIRRLFTAV